MQCYDNVLKYFKKKFLKMCLYFFCTFFHILVAITIVFIAVKKKKDKTKFLFIYRKISFIYSYIYSYTYIFFQLYNKIAGKKLLLSAVTLFYLASYSNSVYFVLPFFF